MAFLKFQIAGFLYVEKGRAGKGAGGLDPASGAFQIGIGETVKIIVHGNNLSVKMIESNIIPVFGKILTC